MYILAVAVGAAGSTCPLWFVLSSREIPKAGWTCFFSTRAFHRKKNRGHRLLARSIDRALLIQSVNQSITGSRRFPKGLPPAGAPCGRSSSIRKSRSEINQRGRRHRAPCVCAIMSCLGTPGWRTNCSRGCVWIGGAPIDSTRPQSKRLVASWQLTDNAPNAPTPQQAAKSTLGAGKADTFSSSDSCGTSGQGRSTLGGPWSGSTETLPSTDKGWSTPSSR